MKPPSFVYEAPQDLGEALDLLAAHGEDAKVLAGGQSLVPMLNFRLARPERLVDINSLGELDYLRLEDCTLKIGALTRHATLERSTELASHMPLLLEAVRLVGHAAIRNRGTVGGSVAHADPAAELPLAFATLDASFHVQSARGARTLRTEELFMSYFTTALEPDELLTEVEVPLSPPRTGGAFTEFSRRHGDFALGGAAALVELSEDGTCKRVAVGLLAAGSTPIRAREAEEWLCGRHVDRKSAAAAAERAAADIRPPGNAHASTAYRRGLIQTMIERALLRAGERARAA